MGKWVMKCSTLHEDFWRIKTQTYSPGGDKHWVEKREQTSVDSPSESVPG